MKGLALYILVLLTVLVIYISMRMMEKKNLGYCLLSIRENRVRSEMFGYNTAFVQMMVFAVSGAIAGLSGVLYTSWGRRKKKSHSHYNIYHILSDAFTEISGQRQPVFAGYTGHDTAFGCFVCSQGNHSFSV